MSITQNYVKNIGNAPLMAKDRRLDVIGDYALEILSYAEGTSFDKRPYNKIRLKVLESSNPSLPVGSEVVHFISLDNVYTETNIKLFLMAAFNQPAEQITVEVVEYCLGATQPLAGRKLRANVGMKTAGPKSKHAGKQFSDVSWTPYTAN